MRFQVLVNNADVKLTSVQRGIRQLLKNRGKKGKTSKKTKLKFQGIRSKEVRLTGADAARKRGDVAVRRAFQNYVLPS